jgi:hypothetical protein
VSYNRRQSLAKSLRQEMWTRAPLVRSSHFRKNRPTAPLLAKRPTDLKAGVRMNSFGPVQIPVASSERRSSLSKSPPTDMNRKHRVHTDLLVRLGDSILYF